MARTTKNSLGKRNTFTSASTSPSSTSSVSSKATDKTEHPNVSTTVKRSNKQKKEFNKYRKKRINEIKKDVLSDYIRLCAMNGSKTRMVT